MNELNEAPAEAGDRRWKAVYTIVESHNNKDKKFWLRIGAAFVNRDQSLNVRLDAMPVNGTLHIRDAERPEDRYGARDGAGPGNPGRPTLKGVQ